jgi:DNA relaxase NicK
MVGSPKSVAMVRLYEKGKQPEYRHLERPNWTRLEVQVRPAKDAKASYAELSPSDVWGATAWTRALAGQVLQEHIDPHPAGTMYRQSDSDRKTEWLCKQYGPHLLDLLAELGSWECVGLTLAEVIKRQKETKPHER